MPNYRATIWFLLEGDSNDKMTRYIHEYHALSKDEFMIYVKNLHNPNRNNYVAFGPITEKEAR